ncbi:MAG: YciI family protein [Ilumatobacteraceae bacterium]
MPEFVALIWEPREARLDPSHPDFMAYIQGYAAFGEIAGPNIRGGAALHGDDTATTIHVEGGQHGDVVMHDGPYAETKELLGGFYVLEAEDLDAAIALARHIPAAWRDGGRVEVRPTMPM